MSRWIGIHLGMERTPGMNGTSTNASERSDHDPPDQRVARCPEVENGETWYQNVYSQSHAWPG